MLDGNDNSDDVEDTEGTEAIDNGGREYGQTEPLLQIDPCADKHCGAGRICQVRDVQISI